MGQELFSDFDSNFVLSASLNGLPRALIMLDTTLLACRKILLGNLFPPKALSIWDLQVATHLSHSDSYDQQLHTSIGRRFTDCIELEQMSLNGDFPQ